MKDSEKLALSLIREAEVSAVCAENECAFMHALCQMSLFNARKFLRMYMDNLKTSQFYLQSLDYLLDNNPTLFTFALALSRSGWHRRYKNKKYLVRGGISQVAALQEHLLKSDIRTLFTYAVNYNIALQPEVLEIVRERALKEAETVGSSLEELMTQKGVSYATIYAYQMTQMDRMRGKRA